MKVNNAPTPMPPGVYTAKLDKVELTKDGQVQIMEITIIDPPKTNHSERIPFKLIMMQCCGSMICHVNHRWPTYCSNCGTRVYPDVRGWATISDDNATLKYKAPKHD